MGLIHDLEQLGVDADIDLPPNLTRNATLKGNQIPQIARVALAAVDTAGGLFAWQNPEDVAVLVHRVVLDVTTEATGSLTADIGATPTSAATSSDNLLDGVDLGAAAGVFDNISNAGTNGKGAQKVAPGKWVTGSQASGASAGIVGYAYIHYSRISPES